MKIALCYHGIAQGYNFKNGGLPVGFNHEFDLMTKNLINENKNYKFDVFLHSWSLEAKEEVLKKMNPKQYMFEAPKNFKKQSFLLFLKETIKKALGKGYEPKRINNIYSRWYSLMKVCELVKKSEENYDLVIVTRFDMCLLNKFNLSNIKTDSFYTGDWIGYKNNGKEVLEENYKNNTENLELFNKGYPFDNEGIQDFFFISSYDYLINSFCDVFYELSSLIKKNGPSNHLITLGKLKDDNMLANHKRILLYCKDYFLSRWL